MSIRRNTLWNLFGSGAPMLAGLLALPFLLRELGVERLGVLTLVWVLIGYFSVFDFGLGRALTQKVSELRAKSLPGELRATVRAGLRLLVWLGLGGAALMVIGVLVADVRWLKVSPGFAEDTRHALLLAAVSLPATTLTSGLKGVLEGMERFGQVNVLRLLLGLANFGAPVISVAVAGPALTTVVFGLVVSRVLIWLLHIVAVKRAMAGLPNVPAGPTDACSKRDLLVFGSWMTVSNLVGPLMVVADRFIVSGLVGATTVAYYTIPSDMLIRMLILPAALSTAAFPALARLLVADPAQAHRLYRRSLRTIALVMLPLMTLVAACAHPGLGWWLGQDFADQATSVVVVLSLGIVLNSLAQIPHALAQAAGRVKETSLLHLAEFMVYAPALYFATTQFGLIGAALAWVGRAAADAALLHALAGRTFATRSRSQLGQT